MPTDNGPMNASKIVAEGQSGESTDIHGTPTGEPGSGVSTRKRGSTEAYYSNKSIRIHARPNRGGLAFKLALPIVASVLAGLLILAVIIRERVFTIQLKDIRTDAMNVAFSNTVLGRLLITSRDKFLRDNPDYQNKAEWKAGNHWLIANNFISERDWVDATGFQLDEYAPSSVMDKAGEQTILSSLSRFLNSSRIGSEVIGVYIQNAEGILLASSQKANFRFDPRAVRAVPWPTDYIEVGNCRLFVDYITEIPPEPMARAIALILSENGEDSIGTVTAILRTNRHLRERNSILFLMLGLTLLLTALAALASWYSARKIATPIRRLAGDMQAIAEGDYSRRFPVRKNDEIGLLAQSFNSMTERLRVANINAKENSRLESDLAIARDIQSNLLPLQTPRIRGLDIHTSYRPAKEIGGDYFDFLPIDEQHVGLVIADASGKSIPAALVMSTTRAILRFVAPGTLSAAETLTRVNSILSVDIPKGRFVTAYYLILDPLEGTMLCASAGHNPLLVARTDDSVELINPGGIALGFDAGPIFQRSIREQRVKLKSGDRVLMYTDGVVECVNPSDEEYSDRRLREFLRRNRDLSSHDFVGALMADLDRHRGPADIYDDTTIMTFKVL